MQNKYCARCDEDLSVYRVLWVEQIHQYQTVEYVQDVCVSCLELFYDDVNAGVKWSARYCEIGSAQLDARIVAGVKVGN